MTNIIKKDLVLSGCNAHKQGCEVRIRDDEIEETRAYKDLGAGQLYKDGEPVEIELLTGSKKMRLRTQLRRRV